MGNLSARFIIISLLGMFVAGLIVGHSIAALSYSYKIRSVHSHKS